MKIAVIAGVPRSLINFRGPMIQAMVDAGHEVVACAPGHPEDVVNALADMGVPYRPIALDRTGINPVRDMNDTLALHRVLTDIRPDMTLGYTIKPVIYGSLAASIAKVPQRYSMITGLGYAFGGGTGKQRLLGTLVQMMYRKALKGNSAVFFQNPDDQQLFIDLKLVRSPKQAVLINGSGVDLGHYARVPTVQDGPVFLLIARLLRDKGIKEYVAAARIVKRQYPKAVFRLVGPFDSNPSAIDESTVRQWQDEGVIEYLGSAKDVRGHIAAASVYVLPSYREGTPRTVLEAMAMGRPIITTDAPGCRETVIDGHNGFLVPVKDASALATAMQRFVTNPFLVHDMGDKAWQMAVNKYDVHKVNAVILSAMGLT